MISLVPQYKPDVVHEQMGNSLLEEIHPQRPGIRLTCNDYNDSSQPVLYQEISYVPKTKLAPTLIKPFSVIWCRPSKHTQNLQI